MFNFKHQLVWIVPLFVFLSLEYIFRLYIFSSQEITMGLSPGAIIILAVISCIFAFFAILRFTVKKNRKELFGFSIAPILLIIGQFLFILFLESMWLVIAVPALLGILLGVYLENIYLRYYKQEKYQEYTLANISGLVNVLIVFLFSTALFGLIIFMGFEMWISTIIVFILGFLITYQNIWILFFQNLYKAWPFLITTPFILAEFFWIINFLPSSIFVDGFIITVLYYCMMGCARNQILGIMNKKVVMRYVAVGTIALFFVFFTAKWT